MTTFNELKRILEESFKNCATITIKELYETLDSNGIPREPIIAGSRTYLALYSLGYGKSGEHFYRKDIAPRQQSTALAVASTPALPPVARTDFADGEPRVLDVDLAAFLGFERPRVIRELIARHSGSLGPMRRTVRRIKNGNNVEEQWLTEHQATYIIAKCETPIANNILQKVVAVFVAARRGQLVPEALANDPFIQLRIQQLKHEERITRLETLAQVAGIAEAPAPKPSEPVPAASPAAVTDFADYVCVWEWAQRKGLNLSWRERGHISNRARKLLRESGGQLNRVASKKWGHLNQYPMDVLDRAYEQTPVQ